MNEEAAFEERLQDVDEVLSLVAESFAEALFDLAENVVEVGAHEGVDGAADGGEKEAVLSAADDGGVFVWELEALPKFAFVIGQFFNKATEVILDFTRGRMT